MDSHNFQNQNIWTIFKILCQYLLIVAWLHSLTTIFGNFTFHQTTTKLQISNVTVMQQNLAPPVALYTGSVPPFFLLSAGWWMPLLNTSASADTTLPKGIMQLGVPTQSCIRNRDWLWNSCQLFFCYKETWPFDL